MSTKINSSQINWDTMAFKPAATQIKNDQAYHTANDDKGRCPYCYNGAEQRLLGSSTIDGQERPTYHCTGCNKAYLDVPSSVKVLLDEAQRSGHQKVGFVPTAGGMASMVNHANVGSYEQQQANQKLDAINNQISNLNNNMYGLMQELRELAQKNNELMEKLATDPMINIRKQVSEFNLK